MFQEERLNKIVELLTARGKLTVNELTEIFGTSKDTARRDIVKLTERRLVRRTHGGILPYVDQEPAYLERLTHLAPVKDQIAEAALALIQEGGTYFIDVSTTTYRLAQGIKLPLRVYSHSLDNAIVFGEKPQVDFHLLGGKYYAKNRFYFSLQESELLRDVHFDAAFIAAGSLMGGGVCFEDQEDAFLKKIILKQSKRKILLAEHEKFQRQVAYSIGTLNDFDTFITDQPLPEALAESFKGETIIVPPIGGESHE